MTEAIVTQHANLWTFTWFERWVVPASYVFVLSENSPPSWLYWMFLFFLNTCSRTTCLDTIGRDVLKSRYRRPANYALALGAIV